MNVRDHRVALAALILFFLGINALWLLLDRNAPTWDDAAYLTASLRLLDSPTLAAFLHVLDPKPPLIAALPLPLYWIAGRVPRAAAGINLLFLALLFLSVFRLARRFASARAGLIAVYAAATMPIVYGLSRWFLTECALMALVAAAIWLIWELESANYAKAAALGIVCAAGMLLKLTFPLYVLAPILYRRPRIRLITLAAITLPFLILTAPWYATHFHDAIRTALDTGSAEAAKLMLGDEGPYSPAALRQFLAKLANAGSLFYLALLPVLLLLTRNKPAPRTSPELRLCAIWASPLLFLLAWPAREVRYAAPLYPALAIALAIVIDSVLERGNPRAWVAAALAVPLLSMLLVSFSMSGPPRFAYARKYDPRPWPYSGLVAGLERAAQSTHTKSETLLVGTDGGRFNADVFALAAVTQRLPLRVATTAYERNWEDVRRSLDRCTYFAYEEGGEPRSVFFNIHGYAAVKEVRESGRFAELPLSSRLPDGGIAHVFENLAPTGLFRAGTPLPAQLESITRCDVTFGGRFRLTGFSVTPQNGGLEVRYRWTCLRPADLVYWCFTHILDAQDHITGYLDHMILNNDPPMTFWQPGDVAVETVRFRGTTSGSHLKLGLYHRGSGTRLPVSSSTLAVTDSATAVLAPVPR